MHKIFAKPLFLGKKVIFLTECHSTNDELGDLVRNQIATEGTIVYTDHQKSGRGQRGSVWQGEPGKNILLSVLLKPNYVQLSEQYVLNIAIGLGVLKSASKYINPTSIRLKWPNDVLVDGKKIAGILIENSLRGSLIENSIVGIGFNLNQKGFSLPAATSVAVETGESVEKEAFIETLLMDLEYYLLKLKNGQAKMLVQLYHENLYQKGELASYRDRDGEFKGMILGVDNSGKLIVSREGRMTNYGIKEIEFLS